MDYIVAVRYESVKEARAQRGPLRQTQRHSSRRFESSYLLSRQTPEGIGGKADENPPTAWAVSPPHSPRSARLGYSRPHTAGRVGPRSEHRSIRLLRPASSVGCQGSAKRPRSKDHDTGGGVMPKLSLIHISEPT